VDQKEKLALSPNKEKGTSQKKKENKKANQKRVRGHTPQHQEKSKEKRFLFKSVKTLRGRVTKRKIDKMRRGEGNGATIRTNTGPRARQVSNFKGPVKVREIEK